MVLPISSSSFKAAITTSTAYLLSKSFNKGSFHQPFSKGVVGYFHNFLPVNSQTSSKTTAITSSMCINAPMPGKAKNPTAQSITIITTIVNSVFITDFLAYRWGSAVLNVCDCEATPTSGGFTCLNRLIV